MDETLEAIGLAARAISKLEFERWGPWVVGLLKILDEQARSQGNEVVFSTVCLAQVVSSVQIRQHTGGWG